MYGTSVRWMKQELSRPSSIAICRIASRNGSDSMSPTVPPISHDRHFGVARAAPDEVLDLVGDVRDHLHRAAEVVAAALLRITLS